MAKRLYALVAEKLSLEGSTGPNIGTGAGQD